MVQHLSWAGLAVAGLVCGAWALVLIRVWQTNGALRRLPTHPPDGARAPPRVSAILALRDESATVERAVRSLLAQEGVQMQVIVVDEGVCKDSRNRVRDIAATDPRVLLLDNHKLPKGWVVKNYSFELGQGRADGDYLLFSEPDVFHARRAVWNAVRVMESERLDHVAVHPRLEAGSLLEAVVLPLYVLIWEFRFVQKEAVQPDSRRGAGFGAFNLVRAESYRLRGTHARIRGALLEDRALGRMMRDDGGRGTLLRAIAQVRVRPFRSFPDLYGGIRRGTLLTSNQSAGSALVMGSLLVLGGLIPPLSVALGVPLAWAGEPPWVVMPAFAGLVLPILGLLQARSMVKFEPLAALLFPLGALFIGISTMQGALLFMVRGRLEWRGHTYRRGDLTLRD